MQLLSTEARQRDALILGRLARDRLHLGDLLRGENGAGDPTALCPRAPRALARGSVFASPRRDRPTYLLVQRCRDWCAHRPPAARAWRAPRPGRATSDSLPAARARHALRPRPRCLLPLVPRHNIRQPAARSFNTTELAAGSTKQLRKRPLPRRPLRSSALTIVMGQPLQGFTPSGQLGIESSSAGTSSGGASSCCYASVAEVLKGADRFLAPTTRAICGRVCSST